MSGRRDRTELTYSERISLHSLVDRGPRVDHDTIEDRVLVNTGYAERYHALDGIGMIRATPTGEHRVNGAAIRS